MRRAGEKRRREEVSLIVRRLEGAINSKEFVQQQTGTNLMQIAELAHFQMRYRKPVEPLAFIKTMRDSANV